VRLETLCRILGSGHVRNGHLVARAQPGHRSEAAALGVLALVAAPLAGAKKPAPKSGPPPAPAPSIRLVQHVPTGAYSCVRPGGVGFSVRGDTGTDWSGRQSTPTFRVRPRQTLASPIRR
jgi:hypothetical protein